MRIKMAHSSSSTLENKIINTRRAIKKYIISIMNKTAGVWMDDLMQRESTRMRYQHGVKEMQ